MRYNFQQNFSAERYNPYDTRFLFFVVTVYRIFISVAQCQTSHSEICSDSVFFSSGGRCAAKNVESTWRDVLPSTEGTSGRLPGDSFCPRRPLRQLRSRERNLKEVPDHYKFPVPHQASTSAAEPIAFY